jgi:hypothetical protein
VLLQPQLFSTHSACAVIYSHLWPVRLHSIFPHYLINGTIFTKKKLLNIKRVYRFSLQLLTNKNSARYSHKCTQAWLHVKYPLFSTDINGTWNFSRDVRKMLKYQISRKSALWEPRCSMRTDRQTDMTKLVVAFRSFSKAPKMIACIHTCMHTYMHAYIHTYLHTYIHTYIHTKVFPL